MSNRLKELYQTQIKEHSKNPFNEGEMQDPTHVLKAYNPLCGDKYSVFLKVEDNTILDASFTGFGCAISKASSSILVKKSIGRNLDEVAEIVKLFLKIIDPESKIPAQELSDDPELLAFSATRKFPERQKCASLSWDEMKKMIAPFSEDGTN